MSEERKFILSVVSIVVLSIGLGALLQKGCNKKQYETLKPDTVVRTVQRPITIRDTIKTKSVLIRYRDSVYFVEKPVEIPCRDTSFVAQADSVITETKDTVNMAFNYRDGFGYFSLVFRPRPDSIITVNIPVEKNVTSYEWLPTAFITGLLFGYILKEQR